jgi:hypothetical protein
MLPWETNSRDKANTGAFMPPPTGVSGPALAVLKIVFSSSKRRHL